MLEHDPIQEKVARVKLWKDNPAHKGTLAVLTGFVKGHQPTNQAELELFREFSSGGSIHPAIARALGVGQSSVSVTTTSRSVSQRPTIDLKNEDSKIQTGSSGVTIQSLVGEDASFFYGELKPTTRARFEDIYQFTSQLNGSVEFRRSIADLILSGLESDQMVYLLEDPKFKDEVKKISKLAVTEQEVVLSYRTLREKFLPEPTF